MRVRRTIKDDAELRKLADEASTDRQTLLKVMLGMPVRRRAAERAREVLKRHHIIEVA